MQAWRPRQGADSPRSEWPAPRGGTQMQNAPRDRGDGFESTVWIQTVIDSLWPQIRKSLEVNLIKGSLEPTLNSFVPGLHFEKASLGNTSPQVAGARTVVIPDGEGRPPKEVHVVLDLAFTPGSAMEIKLAMGPLHAAISDFSFRGRLCICLMGLVPRAPVVSGAKIFFANAPTISFQLSGLAQAAVEPQRIMDKIKEGICAKLVLPNAINVHLDSLFRCFEQKDFLDYHVLHSMPARGILRLSIASLDGALWAATSRTDKAGMFNYEHADREIYALLRVGGKQLKTSTRIIDERTQHLAWPEQELSFIVDSMVEQDVQLELYLQDQERMIMACDELLLEARVSVDQVANKLARTNTTHANSGGASVTISMTDPGRVGRRSGAAPVTSAVIVGSFRRLLATPPQRWEGMECLLSVSVDCVVGLPPVFADKNFSVRASLLYPKDNKPVQEPEVIASSVKTAGVRQVSQARVLRENIGDTMRYTEAKERIRLLHRKGCVLTPEEVHFLLAGLIDLDAAERIMAEVKREKSEESELPKEVEILFEEQLRLEMGDPRRCGLRVELHDESVGKSVGVLEWSALSFLAGSPKLEDELQAYSFDFRGDTRYGDPQIYLTRSLKLVEPAASRAGGHM